jgi:hypothetical protein
MEADAFFFFYRTAFASLLNAGQHFSNLCPAGSNASGSTILFLFKIIRLNIGI